MMKRAAIILSGGKSERFQNEKQTWQDKALVELLGKPLLIYAVENVQNLVEEIVVVVNDERRMARYSEVLTRHYIRNVQVVVDEKIDHLGGPLVAIFTGLKSVKADHCLTLPSRHAIAAAESHRIHVQRGRKFACSRSHVAKRQIGNLGNGS